MEFHEVVHLFPAMSTEEFDGLVESVRAEGLREAIWMHEGKIIDGRHRYLACQKAGVEPRYRQWDGKGSLVQFVVALNLKRRHLTAGQKAAIAWDMLPMLEREARERQQAALKRGAETPVSQKIDEREKGRAAEKAAEVTGANRQYVSDYKVIAAKAPELAQEVRDGKRTIPQAKKELKQREFAEKAPELLLPERKYRVIYADPPWSYGNTMPDYAPEQGHHYKLMSLKDICNMPVQGIAEENAVLFLWVTSPILEESFQVISAWGFKYKSSFIWDKIRHNMGHYNSVRHELLLVAVRGSCQPDVKQLFDSVQSIERAEHSEKPEEFRRIIDTIYPYGKRIELFARRRAEGWDSYGNELPSVS